MASLFSGKANFLRDDLMMAHRFEDTEVSIDLLNNIVRQKTLIAAFDQALQKLQAEESSHNYEQIWAVQD